MHTLKIKNMGHALRLPGMMDDIKLDVFSMKDPDYTMMPMSTYGCLQ